MYLKKLELFGFKSFADKTSLEFEPGISAVVGPNGCGKSNVVDAVRWCLGEQSAKSMRSNQMMDIIFGGSESRQTTGMAEVSLTFDNSQNMLPIDYSEVVVTRRLFRSGESEYYINKSQCRLKDIRDLFLDTGIGSEGYSVIEQGKVEFLISAKPEERREMFEEAAGVSKYKVRREETLRKLEKVEVDMNRINDMLIMLKEQITTLDIAAKKARQYQKSKDELKNLEIAGIIQNIISNQKEIEKILEALNPKSKEYETLNTQLNSVDAEISELRLLHTQKDEIYIKLQEEFSQAKSGISLADEKIRQSVQRETEAKEREIQLSNEIKNNEEKVAQYNQEMKQLSTVLKELNSNVTALKEQFNHKEKQLNEVNKKLEDLVNGENSLKSKLSAIEEDKEKLGTEHLSLKSMLAASQAQVEALSSQSKEILDQSAPFKNEVNLKEKNISLSSQKVAELKNRHEILQNKIKELKGSVEKAYQFNLDIKEKIVSAQSKKRTLQEWEQKDPVRATIKSLKALNMEGVNGPISSLIKIVPGMENIVASALGEKLDYMICDNMDCAKNAIRYLEENNLGRLTFVIADKVPGKGPLAFFTQLSGPKTIISNIECEKPVENVINFLCKNVVLDGNVVYGEAVIQGGAKIASDKPLLIDEQYNIINAEIKTNEKESSGTEEQIRSLNLSLQGLEQESKAVYEEYEKAVFQAEIQKHKLSETKNRIQTFEADIVLKQEQIRKKEEEKEKIIEKVKSIENTLFGFGKEQEKISGELKKSEAELRTAREEELKLRQNVNDANVQLAKSLADLEARQREELKMKESASAIFEKNEQDKKELENTMARIVESQKIQQEESAKIKELQKFYNQKENEVQIILRERQKLLENIEKKNENIHSLRTKSETLKQEMHDLEIDKRSFELQVQNAERRLNDDYLLKYEDIKEQYKDTVIDEEEIQKLKRRIESLGNVNLAAPEEYASLEERYNFLQTQLMDLSKAKDDLHEVIRKINQSTKENFKKTFDAVRENFRNIYSKLFEGGTADIILLDETNILESGIDIIAQPPGKRIQNLSMMSGGEKALTAISLLFAFFMVRPSPFCILDEADAPLDDANIGRYVNLIKEFSQKSQFLIITHNKRTMEMADILYGVTMEEFGVSKVISVRLNKEKTLEESEMVSAPIN